MSSPYGSRSSREGRRKRGEPQTPTHSLSKPEREKRREEERRREELAQIHSRHQWEHLRSSVVDKTFFKKVGWPRDSPEGSRVDMGKIISESWLMEKQTLDNLDALEFSPNFNTPAQQVALLESTSRELNEINRRVNDTLLQYETINNQDDVFQLLDEEDDVQFTAGFDRKSIMEESKGKVKVLIVDYNKLGLKKENVLTSLREWFDEMKNDALGDLETDEQESARKLAEFGDQHINTMIVAAHQTKDKLNDLHLDLLEYYRDLANRAQTDAAELDAMEGGVSNEVVEKLTEEMEDLVGKLRESEGKSFSLERLLERKEDELKFYRTTDNTKTGQLKEELFAMQRKAQEREAELGKELMRTKAQLDKAKQQLDLWVTQVSQKETKVERPNFAKMDASEFEIVYLELEASIKTKDARIARMNEEISCAEAVKEKEMAFVRAQMEEEFNTRSLTTKLDSKAEVETLRSQHNMELARLEESYQRTLTEEKERYKKLFTGTAANVQMWDNLKSMYQDRITHSKETHFQEELRLREENESKILETNTLCEKKVELVMESKNAEKELLVSQHAAQMKRELAALRQEMEERSINENLKWQKEMHAVRKKLGTSLKELEGKVSHKRSKIKEILNQVNFLNDLVLQDDESTRDPNSRPTSSGELAVTESTLQQEKKKAIKLTEHKMKIEKELQ